MEVDDSDCMEEEDSYYNHLADLTTLTHLSCGSALQPRGAPLLEIPNLAELRAGHAHPQQMELLKGRPALRSLGCIFSLPNAPDQARALEQVTQITGLGLVLQPECEEDVAVRAMAGLGRLPPAEAAAERVGAALSTMTGLQRLRLEPEQLRLVDLSPLTALSAVAVMIRHGDRFEEGEAMAVAHLAPVRHRLRDVKYPTWPGVAGTLLGPA
jgi:hypothetical protein